MHNLKEAVRSVAKPPGNRWKSNGSLCVVQHIVGRQHLAVERHDARIALELRCGWSGKLNSNATLQNPVPQHPGVTFYALPDSITHSERPPDRAGWT